MKNGILDFIRNRKKSDYVIVLLIGVFLLLIAMPTKPSTSFVSYSKEQEEDNLEQRLKHSLEQMDGVGKATVMITRQTDGKGIEGVVVITTGADQPNVCKKIMEVILALFDIDAHKIKIVKMVSEV